MKFTLADKTFNTKKAAIEYIRSLKDEYPNGYVFQNEEKKCLLDLISRHPDYSTEYFDTINIKVDHNTIYNNRCFYAIFSNGNILDFSFRNCFNAPTNYSKVTSACRFLISDQIYSFKQNAQRADKKIKCEISKNLYDWQDIVVDHNFDIITFKQLLSGFSEKYKERGFDPLSAKVLSFNNSKVIKFEVEKWNRRWKRYHRKHCVLRCIHSSLN